MLYTDEVSQDIITQKGRLLLGKNEKAKEGETEVICLTITHPINQSTELHYGDMSEPHIADAVEKFKNGAREVNNATGYFRMAVPSDLLNAAR